MNIKTKITNNYGSFYLILVSINSVVIFSEYCSLVTLSIQNDVDKDIFLYAWSENDEEFFKRIIFTNQKYHYCKNKYSNGILREFPVFINIKELYNISRCPLCNTDVNKVNVYPIQSQKTKIKIIPLIDEVDFNSICGSLNMYSYALEVKGKTNIIESTERIRFNRFLCGWDNHTNSQKIDLIRNYKFFEYVNYLLNQGTITFLDIEVIPGSKYDFKTNSVNTLITDGILHISKQLKYSPIHDDYFSSTDYKIVKNHRKVDYVDKNQIKIYQYNYKDVNVNMFQTNDIIYYRLTGVEYKNEIDNNNSYPRPLDITILDKLYEYNINDEVIGIYDISYDTLVIMLSEEHNHIIYRTIDIVGEATFDYVKMEVMSKFTNLIIHIKGKNKEHSIIKKIKNGIRYNNKCLRCGTCMTTSIHTCSNCGSNVTIKYQYKRLVDQLNNDTNSTVKFIQGVLNNKQTL